MAAWQIRRRPTTPGRRLLRALGLAVALTAAAVALASWYYTEPLDDRRGSPLLTAEPRARVPEPRPPAAGPAPAPLAWPEGRQEGLDAKRTLLAALLAASARLDAANTYTGTFLKQERLGGKLGPEQTLDLKLRERPFAIYLKFINPMAGREVVYAEGQHDNKLIAHAAGVARLLVPRLAVPPDHALALADSRHAVTEAGVGNLARRLIAYRRLDLDDPEAVTILDRCPDARGRPRLRSVHTHPHKNSERPFARVEVLYEPGSFLPLDIRNFDWPEPGQTGELRLVEHYSFEDLKLGAALGPLDFDPANPAYGFKRY